jgi:hypothetical protein
MGFSTVDDFRPYEGESFETETAEGAIRLRLDRVTVRGDLPTRADGSMPFVLEFEQSDGPVALPQATWWLAHRDGSELMVFLVPIGIEDGAVRYEAVFN